MLSTRIFLNRVKIVAAEKLLHIILAAVNPLSSQQLDIALCIDEHHNHLLMSTTTSNQISNQPSKSYVAYLSDSLMIGSIWCIRPQENSLPNPAQKPQLYRNVGGISWMLINHTNPCSKLYSLCATLGAAGFCALEGRHTIRRRNFGME